MALQQRLQNHTYRGSIKEYILHEHNTLVIKTQLIENTSILTHAEDRYKLSIREAILILQKTPLINKQHDNFNNILKLYKFRNIPSHDNNIHQNNNNITVSSTPEPQPNEQERNARDFSQHPTNSHSSRLRHQASPQIVNQINELFSYINNSPSPLPIRSQYNLRRRPNQ